MFLGAVESLFNTNWTALENVPVGRYFFTTSNKPSFLDSSFADYGLLEIYGGLTSDNRIAKIAKLTTVGTGSGIYQNVLYTGVDTYRGWTRIDNFGCNTSADLASLLGAKYYGNDVTVLGNSVDLNTLTPGYYRTTLTDTTNSLVNRPSEVVNYLTWIAVIGMDTNTPQTYLVQIMVATNYGIYYRRKQGGSWDSWQKISSDIPSFYKSYSDLSSLATALGVLPKVGYSESARDNYTDYFMMPFVSNDGPVLFIHFPFTWSNKPACVELSIDSIRIAIRTYWNNVWGAQKSVVFQ